MPLIQGIDVSNYQDKDLTGIIKQYSVEHVVVRLSTERQSIKEHARAQLQSALNNGCTVSGYIWAYFELDPEIHTKEAIRVGEGFPLTHIWFDCEAPPRVINLDAWLSEAVKTSEDLGHNTGIYVGRYWWEANKGSDAFGRLPLWVANWDGNPDLHTPLFGGWTKVSGKQWTDTNNTLDRNVFDSTIFSPQSPQSPPSLKERIKQEILPEFEALKVKLNKILSEY